MFISLPLSLCMYKRGGSLPHRGDETWYKLSQVSTRLPFRTVERCPWSHRVMRNFLSNRKHLNVGWRVMELPVETYWGRSTPGVSTPRLFHVRAFSRQALRVSLSRYTLPSQIFCDRKLFSTKPQAASAAGKPPISVNYEM